LVFVGACLVWPAPRRFLTLLSIDSPCRYVKGF
jgi:hypothetical protein